MKKFKKVGAFTTATAYIDDMGYPRCPICNAILIGGVIEYKSIERNGQRYTEFLKFCPTEDCKTKAKYYAKIDMDETIRYSFDDDDIAEIKEEE